MKKKKLPPGTSRAPFEFPPDIFWISPDGVVISVIGHLTALRQSPWTFGFSFAPETKEEIEGAFRAVLGGGWVRGRFSSGVTSFHMERPRGTPLGNAHDFVLRFKSHITIVEVDFYDPAWFKAAKDFDVDDFLDQKFPLSWGINPGRRRR